MKNYEKKYYQGNFWYPGEYTLIVLLINITHTIALISGIILVSREKVLKDGTVAVAVTVIIIVACKDDLSDWKDEQHLARRRWNHAEYCNIGFETSNDCSNYIEQC